ncbi:MAG: hypothetical protein K0U98_27500 [Deltaproteobacteria bacterium]|nr:hypothetical protein [Deltaproteobacteria bacterium]
MRIAPSSSLAVLLLLFSWNLPAPVPAAEEPAFEARASRGQGGGQGEFRCLPSCATDDGLFLFISSGAPLASLTDQRLTLRILARPGGSTFEVGLFDGDSGNADINGDLHWDRLAANFRYSVLTDADGDGVGDATAAGPFDSASLPDNAWFSMQVPRLPEARSSSGLYSYVLLIENLEPEKTVLNSFKVRTKTFVSIPPGQPFGILPVITTLADAGIIYPNFPETLPTTYDGSFSLYLEVPEDPTEMVIWDGDFDFGSFDGSLIDTDDPSTPNAPFLPVWATNDPLSLPEGVAMGLAGTTGNPADDGDTQGPGVFLVRSPNPTYHLVTPDGETFTNLNPSGNREWEQFRISAQTGDPNPFDFSSSQLTAGLYSLEIEGIDLQNSLSFRLDHPVICVKHNGQPCIVPR